jgi:hypothetical protein
MTTDAMLVDEQAESGCSVDAYAEIIATRPLGIWCTVVHQWMMVCAGVELVYPVTIWTIAYRKPSKCIGIGRYVPSIHAKICRRNISLVLVCLQHTKDDDTTTY